MGLLCFVAGHKWNGCTCTRCGSKRNHEWNGCTCVNCGFVRDENHNFISVPDKCTAVCSVCGKEVEAQHEWNDDKCVKCGQSKEEFDFLNEMLALLRSAHRLNMEDYLRSDSSGDLYNVPEAVQIVHQVYRAIFEKYGQAGLDEMTTIFRHKGYEYLMECVNDDLG